MGYAQTLFGDCAAVSRRRPMSVEKKSAETGQAETQSPKSASDIRERTIHRDQEAGLRVQAADRAASQLGSGLRANGEILADEISYIDSRVVAAFVLILGGTALFLFSVVVAFGSGRRSLSLAGITIATLGLSLMFGGYRVIQGSNGALFAAAYLQLVLGFGSTFLMFGLLALFLSARENVPMGYFIATGWLCVLGFVTFGAYAKRNLRHMW